MTMLKTRVRSKHMLTGKIYKVSQNFMSRQSPGPPRLPHPWDFPGKNTGVGCHFLLQYMKV